MAQTQTAAADREFAFAERDFRFLARLVNERTGIVLAAHKRDMVYARLARRLRALNLKSFAQYCELVQSENGDEEMSHLVNAMTTNLTSFFREPHHFAHLREEVLTPAVKGAGDSRRFRIWSAACSSGMEPYSIALTVQEAIPDLARWDLRILASDIDTNMLQTAKAGRYALSQLEHIPPNHHALLNRDEETFEMPDTLKQLIAFRQLNLLEPWPMKGPFDAVFCRNVVIYFDKPTQRTLFSRIADLMRPGGWLYIGHSENLTHVSDRFELCGRTIYRRLP